jgi:hypothetical protein
MPMAISTPIAPSLPLDDLPASERTRAPAKVVSATAAFQPLEIEQAKRLIAESAASRAEAAAVNAATGPAFASPAEQFEVISSAINAEIKTQLGLRGMDLTVRVERAADVEGLRLVAAELFQVLSRAKGAKVAEAVRVRLNDLFDTALSD